MDSLSFYSYYGGISPPSSPSSQNSADDVSTMMFESATVPAPEITTNAAATICDGTARATETMEYENSSSGATTTMTFPPESEDSTKDDSSSSSSPPEAAEGANINSSDETAAATEAMDVHEEDPINKNKEQEEQPSSSSWCGISTTEEETVSHTKTTNIDIDYTTIDIDSIGDADDDSTSSVDVLKCFVPLTEMELKATEQSFVEEEEQQQQEQQEASPNSCTTLVDDVVDGTTAGSSAAVDPSPPSVVEIKVIVPPGRKLGITLGDPELKVWNILRGCISDQVRVGDKLVQINDTIVEGYKIRHVIQFLAERANQIRVCTFSRDPTGDGDGEGGGCDGSFSSPSSSNTTSAPATMTSSLKEAPPTGSSFSTTVATITNDSMEQPNLLPPKRSTAGSPSTMVSFLKESPTGSSPSATMTPPLKEPPPGGSFTITVAQITNDSIEQPNLMPPKRSTAVTTSGSPSTMVSLLKATPTGLPNTTAISKVTIARTSAAKAISAKQTDFASNRSSNSTNTRNPIAPVQVQEKKDENTNTHVSAGCPKTVQIRGDSSSNKVLESSSTIHNPKRKYDATTASCIHASPKSPSDGGRSSNITITATPIISNKKKRNHVVTPAAAVATAPAVATTDHQVLNQSASKDDGKDFDRATTGTGSYGSFCAVVYRSPLPSLPSATTATTCVPPPAPKKRTKADKQTTGSIVEKHKTSSPMLQTQITNNNNETMVLTTSGENDKETATTNVTVTTNNNPVANKEVAMMNPSNRTSKEGSSSTLGDSNQIKAAPAASMIEGGEKEENDVRPSHIIGVLQQKSGKWLAFPYFAGKQRRIGLFDTQENASVAMEISREIFQLAKAFAEDSGEGKHLSAEETESAIVYARIVSKAEVQKQMQKRTEGIVDGENAAKRITNADRTSGSEIQSSSVAASSKETEEPMAVTFAPTNENFLEINHDTSPGVKNKSNDTTGISNALWSKPEATASGRGASTAKQNAATKNNVAPPINSQKQKPTTKRSKVSEKNDCRTSSRKKTPKKRFLGVEGFELLRTDDELAKQRKRPAQTKKDDKDAKNKRRRFHKTDSQEVGASETNTQQENDCLLPNTMEPSSLSAPDVAMSAPDVGTTFAEHTEVSFKGATESEVDRTINSREAAKEGRPEASQRATEVATEEASDGSSSETATLYHALSRKDVIVGRGTPIYNWSGNGYYREVVAQAYSDKCDGATQISHNEKILATEIVQKIQHAGGEFVRLVGASNPHDRQPCRILPVEDCVEKAYRDLQKAHRGLPNNSKTKPRTSKTDRRRQQEQEPTSRRSAPARSQCKRKATSLLVAKEVEYDSRGQPLPKIVFEEDRENLTDYSFFSLKQYRLCRVSESDGEKRAKTIEPGRGGLTCLHCAQMPNPRRFFPSTADALAKTLPRVHRHVLECRWCPKEIKDSLLQLQQHQSEQLALIPDDSKKAFVARMWWHRLRVVGDSAQTRSATSSTPSKETPRRKSPRMTQEEQRFAPATIAGSSSSVGGPSSNTLSPTKNNNKWGAQFIVGRNSKRYTVLMVPPGKLGISLANRDDGKGTVVSKILQSCAFRPGMLCIGDRLVEIDGINVTKMTVEEITSLVASRADRSWKLTLDPVPADEIRAGKETQPHHHQQRREDKGLRSQDMELADWPTGSRPQRCEPKTPSLIAPAGANLSGRLLCRLTGEDFEGDIVTTISSEENRQSTSSRMAAAASTAARDIKWTSTPSVETNNASLQSGHPLRYHPNIAAASDYERTSAPSVETNNSSLHSWQPSPVPPPASRGQWTSAPSVETNNASLQTGQAVPCHPNNAATNSRHSVAKYSAGGSEGGDFSNTSNKVDPSLLLFIQSQASCLKISPMEFHQFLVSEDILSLGLLLEALDDSDYVDKVLRNNGLKFFKRGPFSNAARLAAGPYF